MMSTEMVRLNITLPFSVAEELKQMAVSRKRSQFIADAIKFRIMHLKEKKLEALLSEGYQAEKKEGLKLTKEFEAVDFENWDEY
jgi:metal-responsive CopG/Arc/MetJ family transcriptional regulator